MTDTDEAVERVARAICEMDSSTDSYDRIEVPYIRWYNNAARAALAAADGGEVERGEALTALDALELALNDTISGLRAENEQLRAVADAADRFVNTSGTVALNGLRAALAALHADKEGER